MNNHLLNFPPRDDAIALARITLMANGATTPDIDRMVGFFTRLAQTTTARNSDFVLDCVTFSVRRIALGQPMIPAGIDAWAKEFFGPGLTPTLVQAREQFVADATRIWQEMEQTT